MTEGHDRDQRQRLESRFQSLALERFRARGLDAPGADRLGQIVHGAMAGASAEELRSPDSIGMAALGRIDQLVAGAVEADRPRNLHSAEVARLAQLGEPGALGALGHKAFAELQRARLEAREARDGGDSRNGGGRSGDRYAGLPAAGDSVPAATMSAYVQSYAGAGLGRGTVQTFAEIGLQRSVYDAYRQEGFSREDIGDAAKTTKTLGWKHDRQAFDDIQRSSRPERAALVEIDREKDAEKRKALIEHKRRDLHIDEKPQDAQERWNRNVDRVQRHELEASQKHGTGTRAKQADAALAADRAAEHSKPVTAQVRVATLEHRQAKTTKGASAAADDDFGTTVTPPAKVAQAKPSNPAPKVG